LYKIEYKSGQKGLGKKCESVLRTLPEWFGRENSLQEYVREIDELDTYTAWHNKELVGFFAINHHFKHSVEIHVLGIKTGFHRQGIGRHLYQKLETELKERGVCFIQVKTLSPKAKDKNYDKTLSYYLKMGFTPLEDFPELWGSDTPCLQLIKSI
jgi:ribosomal protein S18 acetylase RimI-like enzyme